MIETFSIGCYFGKRERIYALHDVSVRILEGEQVCISGPSGSGKTTFLNIVGGLQRPTSGELVVQGKRFSELSVKQIVHFRARNTGFVFQSANLIPVLTAFENVAYALGLARPEMSRRAIAEETGSVMRFIGLERRQHLRPCELSGGECQRVAIARAIVKRPSLVLADEPTSHLDDGNTEEVKRIFARLGEEHRATIVIATHDRRLLGVAPRIIHFENGRIARTCIRQYETAEAAF